MDHELTQTVAVLSRTPGTLNALLRDLPEEWTRRNEGGDSWTVFDVLGHLIYADLHDWLPRTAILLQYGDARPFEPFDRKGHVAGSVGKSLADLLDEFTRVRGEAVAALRALHLTDSQLALRGRHPALGSIALSELLATWAVHDLTHLHQISRIMAFQYGEAVGPFASYLGVLQCNGHSA